MHIQWDELRQWLCHSWKGFFLLFVPVVTMALPASCDFSPESRCAYVIIVMALYWMTEATHISVTSLIPIFAFPLMGVLDSSVVCIQYFKESVVLLLGSLLIAALIEHSGLHLRIALNIMTLIGTSTKWLILGVMLTTMLLSMWISNTAVAAMMTPMADAILEQINKADNVKSEEVENGTTEKEKMDEENEQSLRLTTGRRVMKQKGLRLGMFLSIAYSANIGGTGSLFGTTPNVVLNGQLIEYYGENTGLSFATWIMFNGPGMLVNVILSWLYLVVICVGIGKSADGDPEKVKEVITVRLQELGRISLKEMMTLFLFIMAVLLWFFRQPQFMTGWSDLFTKSDVKDSVPAFFVMFLAMVIPVGFSVKARKPEETYLITWNVLQRKVPWGLLLMIGSGFAMSEACTSSGLSKWLGDQLMVLKVLSPPAIVIIVCIFTCALTQVVSNTASANILIPVLCPLAEALHINPLYLTLPAIVTCSYAFILPVATPPNAIVYEASNIKTFDMAKVGIGISVICVAVNFLMINTLGKAIFDLGTFPDWAMRNTTGT